MTEKAIPKSLLAVIEQFDALTANVQHLTAESAGLYRVFEVAMQLVHSQGDWTSAQREQLALAVKACNITPHTAKAIREVEAAGINSYREELERQLKSGVQEFYRPGINFALGLAESLAFHHRMAG